MQNKTFNKRYYRKNAKQLGLTPAQYTQRSKSQFVLLVEGLVPETWDDGSPRLYDSFQEACKWSLTGDLIISEYAFIRTFCN